MSEIVKSHYEKLLLAGACGLVAIGAVWTGQQQTKVRLIDDEYEQPVLTGAVIASTEAKPVNAGHLWAMPSHQTAGSRWLYEVFTPPVIYYNATARSFVVTPAYYAAEATDTLSGVELLEVKLAPYRLQLAGYFGGPGDYLAAFVSSELPQTLLAREGRRFEQLGLTLKRFDVRKVAVETDGAGPVYDIAALAVLHDEQTGGEVVLDSRTTKFADTPLAVLRVPDDSGGSVQLQEGGTFNAGAATYRIERIQIAPPEVVVARSTPGEPLSERKILRPAGAAMDHAVNGEAPSDSVSPQPGWDVATHGQ